MLDHAVVQRGRDPPALLVGSSQGPLHQPLAFGPGPSRPDQRQPPDAAEQDDQGQQGAEHDTAEGAPQLVAALADHVVPEIGLEQERLPVRRPDRPVHLEQFPVTALEPVLRQAQVADVGVGAGRHQRGAGPRLEGEGLADQARLVGVQHHPGRGPHLHPDHGPILQPVAYQRVEDLPRLGRVTWHGVGQRGLDHAVGQVVGQLGDVVDRFGPGDPLADHGSAYRHDDRDDQRRERDREQDPAQAGRLLRGTFGARPGQHDPPGGFGGWGDRKRHRGGLGRSGHGGGGHGRRRCRRGGHGRTMAGRARRIARSVGHVSATTVTAAVIVA